MVQPFTCSLLGCIQPGPDERWGSESTDSPDCPCPAPLGLPPPAHGPGPHVSPTPPPQCRQPLPPAMPQLGFSQPFPAWPWPPLARPMHESTSRPSLSLSPSPGRHLMAGAAPVPLAAQFLAGAVGWALAASPCLGAPSMGAPDAPSTQVAAGSSCPLPWKKL